MVSEAETEKGSSCPREGSLRSEGDSFTYTGTDPLRQSADLFRPTEGPVRLTETLRPTDAILEEQKVI